MKDQFTEYKQSWNDDYLEYVSSFSNSQGGCLYIGINDDGTVCRVKDIKELLEDIPNKVKSCFSLNLQINGLVLNGPDYLEINIPKSDVPISYRGKYYMRSGSVDLLSEGVALTSFLLASKNLNYEDSPSKNQDLTFKEFEDLCKIKNFELNPKKYVTSGIVNNGEYSILGELISDQNPVGIKFAIYDGKTPVRFRVKKVFEGKSILLLIDDILDFSNSYNNVSSEIVPNKASRVDSYSYPGACLREVIVNSVVHCDYLSPSDIKVEFFEDRCVVTSPGGLFGITIEQMLGGKQAKRNPKLALLLDKLGGYSENFGSGIPRVLDAYNNYKVKPSFESSHPFFTVVLPDVNYSIFHQEKEDSLLVESNNNNLGDKDDILKEESDEDNILKQIILNKSITQPQLAKALNISDTTVYRTLEKLKVNNKIVRVGSRKKGYWEIVSK